MAKSIAPKRVSQDVQRRPGAAPFGSSRWRGINTQKDPGSLLPWEPQWVENMRLGGAGFRNRAGLTEKIDLNDFSDRSVGAVNWFDDDPSAKLRTSLYCAALGCNSALTSGFQVFVFDATQDPAFQTFIDARATSDRFTPLGKYGDDLYIGDSYLLKKVVFIGAPAGVNVNTILGSNAQPLEQKIAFDGYTIRCMRQHEGLFYIGLENNSAAANSKIVVFDGQQFRDDLTGIRPPLAFGIWQNKLVAGFDATAGHIRVRTSGSTVPGTWTTFALGGFSCSVSQNAMQEVRDKLWIASGSTILYSFDGTTLTAEQTIAGADNTGDGITSVCLHDDLLHYAWNAAATFNARLGRHDPDSSANAFVDTYKDLTAGVANFKRAVSVESFRRRIIVGGQGGVSEWLIGTDPNDVQGTLSVLSSGSATAGFRLRQLLVV